jgi:hypothetical protein
LLELFQIAFERALVVNYRIGSSGPLEWLAAYGFVVIAFLALAFAVVAPLWIWASNIHDRWPVYSKNQRIRALGWYFLFIGVSAFCIWRSTYLAAG